MNNANEKPKARQLEASGRRVRIARRAAFSSAHFYHQPKFNDFENRAIFGRCFTPYGHGHNYVVEAFLEGPIDFRTGLLANLIDIDKTLLSVTDRLDHQHLNFDIAYFKDRVPTTEIIAQFCFRELRAAFASAFQDMDLTLVKVRLFEMDDLWVEYAE